MKRKLMFLVAVLALVSSASFAQLKVGGGLSLGTKSGGYNDSGDSKIGIGINARVDYAISEKFSIVPNFTFWFPSAPGDVKISQWQLNADAHYTFAGDEAMSFYGIGGLNYTFIKVEDFDDNEIGLNLGVGTLMKGKFYGEVKFDTAGNTVDGQLALTVGILF